MSLVAIPERTIDPEYLILSRTRLSRIAVAASVILREAFALVATHVGGGAVDLLFQLADLLLHRALAVEELLDLLAVAFGGATKPTDLVGDLLLLVDQLPRAPHRIGDVAFGATGLRSLQLLFRLSQPLERFSRLRP